MPVLRSQPLASSVGSKPVSAWMGSIEKLRIVTADDATELLGQVHRWLEDENQPLRTTTPP